MIIYFDTETTGLYPGNIIQLSYIVQDEFGSRGKNFYFYTDYIEPSATKVHGITVEKLKELSQGKRFSDFAEEIYNDFANSNLVISHNFRFDLNFMLAEFSNISVQFRYNQSFDTMKYFTPILKLKRTSTNAYKYPKLSELCQYFSLSEEEISNAVCDVFNSDVKTLHEARFDTTAMYLCVKKSGLLETELKQFIIND